MNSTYLEVQKNGGFYKLDTHFIKLDGEKAARFLHGQLTNHIEGLAPGEGAGQSGHVILVMFVLILLEILTVDWQSPVFIPVPEPVLPLAEFAPVSQLTSTLFETFA